MYVCMYVLINLYVCEILKHTVLLYSHVTCMHMYVHIN